LILFWYDVSDFNDEKNTNIGFDKYSRLQHAWAIFNSYLSSTARFNIGLPNELAEEARRLLQSNSSSTTTTNKENQNDNSINKINTNIFKNVMEKIIPFLLEPWINFLKNDITKYTKSKLDSLKKDKTFDEDEDDDDDHGEVEDVNSTKTKTSTATTTAAASASRDKSSSSNGIWSLDIVVENEKIYLKRTKLQRYLSAKLLTPKERQQIAIKTNQTSDSGNKKVLTEKEKLLRKKRLARMELERKKAIQQNLNRTRANNNKNKDYDNNKDFDISYFMMKSNGENGGGGGGADGKRANRNKIRTFQTDKGLFFNRMLATNKIMIQMFQKFFIDEGKRNLIHKFSAFLDAKQFLESTDQQRRVIISTAFKK
jgi:hypothetical protein